jgi:four helix bundle protein
MIINSYKDLRVFQNAMGACMDIFEQTKAFPGPERFALVDQVRRSSRSVCANLAEAWRRRRYEAAFVAKLCDSESEASETQVWIEIARRCGYFQEEVAKRLDTAYDQITAQIVRMTQEPQKWLLREQKKTEVPGGQASRAVSISSTSARVGDGSRKH